MGTRLRQRLGLGRDITTMLVRAVHRRVPVRLVQLLVNVSAGGWRSVRASVVFTRRRRRGQHREARCRLKANGREREQTQDEASETGSAPS